jgi:alkylhydroperoxidase family enzyme
LDLHLRPFFEAWLDTFIYRGRLDAQLRELAILRVMWRCQQAFEWGNHYRHARHAGVTPAQVLAIRTAQPDHDLEGPIRLVVRAADEVVDAGALSEQTASEVLAMLGEASLFDEFLYVVAGYRMFATVAASRRERYRGAHRLWPPDGIGPTGT